MIWLIPLLGWIWALVALGFREGDYGDNEHGGEDVSSSQIVSKWTFLISLAFAVVLFSAGIWVRAGNEPVSAWGLALQFHYIPLTVGLLFPSDGSLRIWLKSRR